MIETRDLTKMYGDLYALNRLSIKLERGDVYGFIGPNGAGKTTTMRILATLLNPTWGEATVCGFSIYNGAKEIRRLIGYMPDFFGVYDDMKVIEYLEFFAAAYRIKGPERRRKCDQVLELVDLGYKRDALVTSLSRGMTQRLGLARVLLHEPQVLLEQQPHHLCRPRADGHAQPQFARALGHRVRGDAVDPDQREHHRQRREQCEQRHAQPARRGRARQRLIQAHEVADGLLRIELAHGVAHRPRER